MGIREPEVRRSTDGQIQHMRIVFGPHHFLELTHHEGEKVEFVLGYTHHGFRADASEVNGELERIIGEVREAHPETLVD